MMEEGKELWKDASKAAGWGLVGIPLGIAMGGMAGVIGGTVVVAVAGVLNWGGRHMCEPRRGVPVRAYAAAGGLVVAVVAVHAVLPFALPAAAVLVVLAPLAVLGLRRARRLCVPRSSRFHGRYQQIAAPRRRPVRRPALTRGPLAIENTIRVTPDMIVHDVRQEAR